MIAQYLTTAKPSIGCLPLTGETLPLLLRSAEEYERHSTVVTRTVPKSLKRRGRPSKITMNPLKPYLSTFTAPGHALAKIPGFDNIITGAVNIDLEGNTRPLSKKVVVGLLRELDAISTKGIMAYMELTLRPCGDRHAQKYGEILRIIITACSGLLGDDWLNNTGIDDSDLYRSAPIIEPCGNNRCIVCASHTKKTEAEFVAMDFESEGYLN